MASNKQPLILEPAVGLTFKGPFTNIVFAYLKLTNPTEKRIFFKVRTTVPRQYCVRPNSGILDPKANVSVAVMLQPFEYDPKKKPDHKFKVESMYAPDHPVENEALLWKNPPPESVMQSKKLLCFFEEPCAASDAKAETSAHNDSLKEIMSQNETAEAIIVVRQNLWKCVNCNLIMSYQHSIDEHIASQHNCVLKPETSTK